MNQEVNIEDIEILLVDDDEAIRDSLGDYLDTLGWKVRCASRPSSALEILADGYGDIVISDIKMPEMDGITLLGKIQEIDPDIEVLIITGHSNESLAIEALKAGAFDYFSKPLNAVEIIESLHRTSKYRQLKIENRQLKKLVQHYTTLNQRHSFFAKTAGSQALLKKFQKVADAKFATTFLNGESGVGKEVAARMIHQLSAPKAPFVAVNCAGLPESLLESELFGHEKGAFTGADKQKAGVFEIAQGGTIFLDEISEMSMEAQTRFLRALEERSFRRVGGHKEISFDEVRVITASNRDLHKEVEAGRFRHDLLYRILVADLRIPPLRERQDDIMPLAQFFLDEQNQKYAKQLELSKAAQRSLMTYDFPGNIRELRNMIERALIFSSGSELTAFDLGLKAELEDPETNNNTGISLDSLSLKDHEAFLIKEAIRQFPGHHSAAARALGISPQALYRKIEKFEI